MVCIISCSLGLLLVSLGLAYFYTRKSAVLPIFSRILLFIHAIGTRGMTDIAIGDVKGVQAYRERVKRFFLFAARVMPRKKEDLDGVSVERIQISIEATVIDGEEVSPAGTLDVIVVKPEEATAPLPSCIYFHGGGFVLGTHDKNIDKFANLAKRAGCAIFSVKYRLAPEYKYPIPVFDAYGATLHFYENAHEYGIDPNRIGVAGSSAGGNLAAVVCVLAAADRQMGRRFPKIKHQLLLYPTVTVLSFISSSAIENKDMPILSLADMGWFWAQYLPQEEPERALAAMDFKASPLMASLDILKLVPPCSIVSAEFDVLRDDSSMYAKRLMDCGVDVQEISVKSLHGFFGVDFFPEAELAFEAIVQELQCGLVED